MPGQKIGRFEILNELGQGSHGTVYLAHDLQLDRRVVIKTLCRTGQHEAHIVSSLQHPNIIALYDSGEHQGSPYLVYAFVEGETLSQLLKQDHILPFVRAAEIACGVLAGLACAHAQGVLHLDIKPANVMISGVPMVMDFGQAMLNGDDAISRYMAPELISDGQYDEIADIYSVGAILYEMVTGECPAGGDNGDMAHAIAAPSSRNIRVDEKLEAIILKAVAKNPPQDQAGSV